MIVISFEDGSRGGHLNQVTEMVEKALEIAGKDYVLNEENGFNELEFDWPADGENRSFTLPSVSSSGDAG